MKVVLDSCSVINLINGEAFIPILNIPNYEFYVGQFVLDECLTNDIQKSLIKNAFDNNLLKTYSGNISLSVFQSLQELHNIGDGETECIAIGIDTGYFISTDDRKAREAAKRELGSDKVIGTLFLLKQAVKVKLLRCEDVRNMYILMKLRGGFLPKVDDNYLCK